MIFPTFCIQSVYVVIITLVAVGGVLGNHIIKENKYRKYNWFGCVSALVLSFSFCVRWYISTELTVYLKKINDVCDTIYFVVPFAFVCAVFGSIALSVLFDFVKKYAIKYNENKIVTVRDDKITIKEMVFVILTAFFTITLCSKSSFMYAFNDWQDANCFFTVGRAIVNKAVLYRDIYEQKGPLLYFLHAFASIISDRNFLGVYFIEIICCAFFLIIVRKMLKLYLNGNVSYYIPFIAMCVYSSVSFYHGDSAEELCLPLLAYGLYISLKTVKRRTEVSCGESFLLGICVACVIWIKFSMIGFYIGMMVIPVISMLRNKKIKLLLKQILLFLAGVLLVSVPIFIYFGLNNAINHMFEGYFYNNIFLYSRFNDENNEVFAQPLFNLFSAFNQLFSNNIIAVILIVIGLIWLFYSERKKVFCHMIFTIAAAFFFTYIGGRSYRYYALIFGVFSFCGVIVVDNIKNMYFSKVSIYNCLKKPYTALVLSMALCVLFSSNTPFMSYKKTDLPQYQFAEIINRKEDATLLNYKCLDGGFYNAAGIIPQNKFFCRLNIELEEMYAEQELYYMLGITDYIVTDRKIESENYEFVKVGQYKQGFYNRTYYLYRSRNL